MAVTLPSIDVSFTQRAASLLARSERGIAILIVRDATKTTSFYSFQSCADAEKSFTDFTSANQQAITDVYTLAQPYRLCVVRIGTSGTISDATAIIEANVRTGWVTVADGTAADFTALITWIGTCESNSKTYKAIVHGVSTAPDKRHVVDLINLKVTFSDTRGEKSGAAYLPSLLGMLAGANVTSGVTNAKCTNLSGCAAVSSPDTAVGAGQFVLIQDVDGVYVGVGVNSLTTTNGKTLTEDMKYIETVEAMDLISDDIREEFRNTYLGKYKNSLDNQMLFIAAVRGYFASLAGENILDPDYENTVDIDVASQRAAWVAAGKSEASEWTDAKVRQMAFKRTVYLTADIKILGSMENLKFEISMA